MDIAGSSLSEVPETGETLIMEVSMKNRRESHNFNERFREGITIYWQERASSEIVGAVGSS